ncbi:DUF2066 domain-containing protein [Dasania marina]|uniref:DUF2066 domain-containing protein n=1 Tax=Dasania marina TaxID=471499 RepID=UPI00037A1378|nr:DUF2066 domain-containing protein [Dasania marina]
MTIKKHSKYRVSSAWLLVLWCLITPYGHSAEVARGLYSVEQALDSQSYRDRLRAASQGLSIVLVRISGHHSVLENDQVKAKVRQAERFLKRFSYYRQPTVEGEQEQLMIKMEFEASLIDDLLRSESLPIWSANRPSILVWAVVDGAEGRRFVGAADGNIVEAIQQQAARRGLVVKLPSLDLEDTIAISPDELWQMNLWSAQRAAARYKADSLLIGRMTALSNGEWLGRWQFSDQGERSEIEGQAPQLDEYVGTAMDVAADQLASKYAIVPVKMSEDGIVIRLTGIKDFTAYARAVDYLQKLSAVRYANPIYVENQQLFIHLIADGQLEQLEQTLALGQKLEKIAALDALQAANYPAAQLNYHWPSAQ